MDELVSSQSATASTDMDVRRVTIKLTPDAYDELKEQASERRLTITALIRKALATERFFYENRNAQILLKDGVSMREVVLVHD